MKHIQSILLISLLTMICGGCDSPLENERIDEFSLESGGYMRVVTPYPVLANTFTVSLANMSGTKLECQHEAITKEKGALFSSYDLTIRFVDNTPANGTNNVSDVTLRKIPASSYTRDAGTGYPRATMTITGEEALKATGLDPKSVSAGDRFEVTGTMLLTDGKSFTASNTTIDITGGAFYSSPFFYRINVGL
jgi:hypothetical protein